MGKLSLTQFAGMVTAPGLLERNEASCIDAFNWEFPAPGLVRKRRGFAKQPGNTGGPVWALMTSRLLDQQVFAHVGTTALGNQVRIGSGAGALAAIPAVDAGTLTRDASGTANPLRMHLAVCQRNHYLTADEGVARVESGLALARYAGMPRGLGLVAVAVQAGVANPLANGFARAYRVTWHRKDGDGVELGGAPTGRFVVSNSAYTGGYTGAARKAVLSFRIPLEFGTAATALTTSYFWRLWGTRTYDETTQLGDDEMHLVSEAYLTAPDLAAGYVASFSDDTPDAFLQSSPRLHTNLFNYPPGEAGLLQGVANEDAPPPVANDVAYWQDVMWFADYAYRPRLTLALIAPLLAGDTVTITTATGGGVVLTAGVDFAITVGFAPAVDLRETVRSLVDAISKPANATIAAAFGVGTTSTQPGLFYIESNLAGANGTLAFNTSVPTKFQTTEGYVFGQDASSGPATNGLAFSKPLRADAVPPVNTMTAGPADSRILRIMPFRDRLLVFTDYGIFQVTGRTYADFSINPFDLGYRLIGRELVAECDEKIYAWCNEGIIEIDDGGVTVVSMPIEPTIEAAMVTAARGVVPLLQTGRAAVGQLGFATAYRNQHQVRFHYPSAVDLSLMFGSTNWLSFDTRTRAWARGQFSPRAINSFLDARTAGVVRFGDDLICFGCWSSGADTYLFLERRAYTSADFTDDARDGTTAAVVSTARFQYQVPDEVGAQHWQQTVINWDAGEITWRGLPSVFTLTHTTEEGSAAPQNIANAGTLVTRVETPVDARRGQRLALEISHATAEYAGFVGVSQSYRSGSRFARKVTP